MKRFAIVLLASVAMVLPLHAESFRITVDLAGKGDANLADFPRLAGETDDSPRFSRAISAAPNGVLCVPKGEYDIATTILVHEPLLAFDASRGTPRGAGEDEICSVLGRCGGLPCALRLQPRRFGL